jgi:hypothetical protein
MRMAIVRSRSHHEFGRQPYAVCLLDSTPPNWRPRIGWGSGSFAPLRRSSGSALVFRRFPKTLYPITPIVRDGRGCTKKCPKPSKRYNWKAVSGIHSGRYGHRVDIADVLDRIAAALAATVASITPCWETLYAENTNLVVLRRRKSAGCVHVVSGSRNRLRGILPLTQTEATA